MDQALTGRRPTGRWSDSTAPSRPNGPTRSPTPTKPNGSPAYETWLHHYNHHRPHTGIDGQIPSARVHNLTGKYSVAAPALLAALPIGRLSDRFGGAILACVGTLMMIASTVAFVVVPGLPILLVASATLGLGNLAVVVGQQTFVAHRTRGSASDSGFGNSDGRGIPRSAHWASAGRAHR